MVLQRLMQTKRVPSWWGFSFYCAWKFDQSSRLENNKNNSRGAGNDLWSCRFSAFHDRPSWESVNHSRTIARMLEMGWEQLKQVRLRSHSAVWSEFAFGPFGHCFLCCNQFFSWVMWSLRFPFFWSCVCHCMRFTTQRTRPVNIDCSSTPDLWLTSPL